MRATKIVLGAAVLVGIAACASDGEDGGGDGDGFTDLRVSGVVVDFQTGDPISGAVSVTTQGLVPAPTVAVTGAEYALEGVTAHSVFYVLAGAPPTHRSTFGAPVEVEDGDEWDVDVPVVAEAYLAELAEAFGVSPSAATGVLLLRAVGGDGGPLAGVDATAFVPPPGADGPFFLDAQLAPAPAATETSASGWAVFFEVTPGLVSVTADGGSGITIDMPVSPIAPAVATITDVRVTDGAPPLPQNVSFAEDVYPIFEARGCRNCHAGSGSGRELGGLALQGSPSAIWRELLEEPATAAAPAERVNLTTPEASLILTMPSAEDPPDRHPNITFTGPIDPDYLTILAWIREGARDN